MAAQEGLRERAKRERSDRIVQAACELVREDPDHALTVERIADRAGVAPKTVFNLVGRRDEIWAAIAERTLRDLDLASLATESEPQRRARSIVSAVASVAAREPVIFRALLSHWSSSARMIHHDPTDELVVCFQAGVRAGTVRPDVNHRRLAQQITAGMIGLMHQWAVMLLSDSGLRTRARDLVDTAFVAAHPIDSDHVPPWHLVRHQTGERHRV